MLNIEIMGLFDKLKDQALNGLNELQRNVNNIQNQQQSVTPPPTPQAQMTPPPAPQLSQVANSEGIYGNYMEHLIDMALADGELTEKEKQVLFKKAAANGIDLDEFDKNKVLLHREDADMNDPNLTKIVYLGSINQDIVVVSYLLIRVPC
jgi:uncharacterized membrane protein YebE (DUF533 family)